MNQIFRPSSVYKQKRILTYGTLARPGLLYGSELWAVRR